MNVKPGDMARCVKSVDGLNVGVIVEVCSFQGVHSKYGTIWRCKSKSKMISEYGAVGNFMDFADDWLRKIEPDDPALHVDKEVHLAA